LSSEDLSCRYESSARSSKSSKSSCKKEKIILFQSISKAPVSPLVLFF
jgi:hypothetical protein